MIDALLGQKNSGVFTGDWVAQPGGPEIPSINPATGEVIATATSGSRENYEQVVTAAQASFQEWRELPAPPRGEFIRRFGQALRNKKEDLGLLVTLETGKILSEGRGE